VKVGHAQMISWYAAYYLSLSGMPEKATISTVTVSLPQDNLFSVANLRRLMEEASQGMRKLQ
jgi:hypothetical protein